MKLTSLLDTNICIHVARRRPPAVWDRLASVKPGTLGISVITWGELCLGAEKSTEPSRNRDALKRFVAGVPIQPLTPDVGRRYGELRAALERSGMRIGNNDLWIAAHALALGVTRVTNNVREFKRVPCLRLETWV